MALRKAIQRADDTSILAIAKKIGALLCVFQNLFVLLALFSLVIQVFRDILSLVFPIKPCDDSDPTDADGCCTPDVCPNIIKGDVTRTTGVLQYLPKTNVSLPPPFVFNIEARGETWQLYDASQTTPERFRNVFDGYDIPPIISPKPVFYPTDAAYSSITPVKQAAYTTDLKFHYNPINWGRTGEPRNVIFKDCIVITCPTDTRLQYDNSLASFYNGVLRLGGGLGYEENGTTILYGFATDGVTPSTNQATLDNFLHKADVVTSSGTLLNDGYYIGNIEYSFKPNIPTLYGKQIITSGCIPDIETDRSFVNNVIIGDVNITIASLNNLINGDSFPDTAAAQECLTTALLGLKGNLTVEGAAQFQLTATACLNKLKDDTENALDSLIGLGIDPCKSKITLDPAVQFTSRTITVSVDLNEKNGTSMAQNLSPDLGKRLAAKLVPHIDNNKGEVTNFTYDGYQYFTATLMSPLPVIGQISVSFDNQTLCTNTIPTDIDEPAEHTLQMLDYQFIFTPGSSTQGVSEFDPTGAPRRDAGDISRDIGNSRK